MHLQMKFKIRNRKHTPKAFLDIEQFRVSFLAQKRHNVLAFIWI